MYFNIDGRDSDYRNRLRLFIQKEYSLKIVSLNEHNRGFYSETWKIECEDNCRFFVKIIYFERHAKKYVKCFRVLDYMKKNGIDFVSQAITTASGKPYLFFNKGILAVFKFVDGVHAEDKPAAFVPYMAKIYKLPKPDFKIEHEDFSTDTFSYLEKQVAKLKDDTEILGIIKPNWDLLVDADKKQKHFSQLCEDRQKTFVITSGDIGGNSLAVNGRITIVDWDWIKLAPPERDFWWYAQDPNQITEINTMFRRENFDYSIDNDILGYYAYFSFIYFLAEIISAVLYNPVSRPEVITRLNEYFSAENCMLKCMLNISH